MSQLEGKAESACSIKDFDSWDSLKDFLKNQFGERKHYAHLLTDLQDCRQGNESVNQFSLRVETCLSKLLTEVSISSNKKSELSGRLAAMEDLALHTFTLGLHPRLANIVRCRDPKNLNDAINYAVSEEKIQQFTFRNNNIPNNNARKPPPSRPTYNDNNTPSSSQKDCSSVPVCRYCKKPGHVLENCRLRDYNNKRFSTSGQSRPQPFSPVQSSAFKPGPKRVNFTEENVDEEDPSYDEIDDTQDSLNC